VREELEALATRVGAFHITDKAMLRAQREIEAALAAGEPSAEMRAQYLRAVERYFGGFEREARAHLRDVDKRLENLNQVIFNLTAERGVAVKRIEATQSVLASLRALEEEASR
jgi:hypothetical protein